MSDSKDVLSRRGLLGGVQKDFQVVPRQVDIKNDSPEECAPGEGSQSWDVDGVVSDESLCESELHTLIIGREAMACRFDVVFNAGEYPQDTQWALAALDLIDVIESRLSVYRASSELTLLNQSSSQDWQTVADDLYGLLEQCRSISTATGELLMLRQDRLFDCGVFSNDKDALRQKMHSKRLVNLLACILFRWIRSEKEFDLKSLGLNSI